MHIDRIDNNEGALENIRDSVVPFNPDGSSMFTELNRKNKSEQSEEGSFGTASFKFKFFVVA